MISDFMLNAPSIANHESQITNARRLTIDGGEQVVDVLVLEQLLAQRLQRRAALGGLRASLAVPLVAQLLDPALVLLALAIDRRTRRLEPRAEPGLVAA